MCKPKKTLYGFKQSLRMWYHCIHSFFINEDFSRIKMDHSLYVKQTGELLLLVILYVNDLITLANDVAKLKWFKSKLDNEFEMSDLGELYYCLQVELERNRKVLTIVMSHWRYTEEVVKCLNMEDRKPIRTPSNVNSTFLRLLDEEYGNVQGEMEGIGNSYAQWWVQRPMLCLR